MNKAICPDCRERTVTIGSRPFDFEPTDEYPVMECSGCGWESTVETEQ